LNAKKDAMSTIRSKYRHAVYVGLLCVAMALEAGCTMVDGYWGYACNGRMLWRDTNTPAADVELWIAGSRVPEDMMAYRTQGASVVTDEQGRYSASFSGGMWGYTLLFGLVPLGSTSPPVPPELSVAYVYVRENGQWREVEVPLPQGCQQRAEQGKRHITVPDIRLLRRPAS
jgi:hypothetical protein